MYLLATDFTGYALPLALTGSFISLIILYLIIKGSVAAGTREHKQQLYIQSKQLIINNRLLAEKMRKESLITDDRLKEIYDVKE